MFWLLLSLGSALAIALPLVAWWLLCRNPDEWTAARTLFALQRPQLEQQYFNAAATSGKPRGLRWKAAEWTPGVTFGRERKTGRLVALVGVTLQFEAIEGGDMEGLPAVGNLRNASAVFFYQQRRWQSTGLTVFNLNPDEALEHFKNQYEPLAAPAS